MLVQCLTVYTLDTIKFMSGYTFIEKKVSPGLKTSVYVRKISIHLKKMRNYS